MFLLLSWRNPRPSPSACLARVAPRLGDGAEPQTQTFWLKKQHIHSSKRDCASRHAQFNFSTKASHGESWMLLSLSLLSGKVRALVRHSTSWSHLNIKHRVRAVRSQSISIQALEKQETRGHPRNPQLPNKFSLSADQSVLWRGYLPDFSQHAVADRAPTNTLQDLAIPSQTVMVSKFTSRFELGTSQHAAGISQNRGRFVPFPSGLSASTIRPDKLWTRPAPFCWLGLLFI